MIVNCEVMRGTRFGQLVRALGREASGARLRPADYT